MQAKKPEAKKKIVIPVVAVIGVALVLFLSNRPARMPNGMPVIESEEQYNYALQKVTQSTPTAVGKFNVGLDLDQKDKDVCLEGAKTFDTMNAFRPDMAAGYFEAGLLYYLGGDTDSALSRLDQCLANADQPFNLKTEKDKAAVDAVVADCHHMLSLVAFDRHDYQTALQEANAAFAKVKPRPGYYVARARAEIQLNKNSEARKDVSAALKLDPSYLPAHSLDGFLKHTS